MHPIGKCGFTGALLTLALMAQLLLPASAWAFTTDLPLTLARDVLSETVPTAFAAFNLAAEDYGFEWVGKAPSGVELQVLPGTIQWVRVADVLSLPRARLLVKISGGPGSSGVPEDGRVSNAGFSQAFAKDASGLRGELPIALISGESNPIDIALKRGGKVVTGKAVLRFKPRASLGPDRIFYDASCSRFGVRVEGSAQSAKGRGWGYVGCRVAEVEGAAHRTSSLEAWVYWDGVGQSVLIGGVPTPASSASVWPLRLRTDPGHIQLAVPGGGDEMTLNYSTPDYFHRGSIGVGLGPYWDRFDGNGETLSTAAPVLTLYGSYFITEALRVVSFDATTLDSHLTTDLGVYLNTEYVKFYDRRIVINLLLGAHAIGFNSAGAYYLKIGAPQGVEIWFLDFAKKGYNLNTGFFIYPKISGVSYYNLWLRWGTGKLFGEFNYISWDEVVNDQPIHASSVGLSLGMPLFRFF